MWSSIKKSFRVFEGEHFTWPQESPYIPTARCKPLVNSLVSDLCFLSHTRLLHRALTLASYHDFEISQHACSAFFTHYSQTLKKVLLPLIVFFKHAFLAQRLDAYYTIREVFKKSVISHRHDHLLWEKKVQQKNVTNFYYISAWKMKFENRMN